jgi:AcrR family transcriptional regulator
MPPRGRMRAAQREFTRSRLVDAAVGVFAERGYARATIDDIAERAGTTRATFYLHFKSKSDVIPELMTRGESHFRGIYECLIPLAKDPTLAGARMYLSVTMAEWKTVADLSRPVHEAATIEPEINEMLAARNNAQIMELADALRAGVASLSAADAEVYATVLLAPMIYYFQLFLRGQHFNERRVLDAMARATVAILADLARTSPLAKT